MLTRRHRRRQRRGGTNPVQVGLGVQLAATSTNFTQGSAQTTGRATDLMIQGDGFFVLGHGNERSTPAPAPSPSTRAAPWSPRAATGCRATPDGTGDADRRAWSTSTSTPLAVPPVPAGVELTSYNIGADGKVRGIFDDGVQRDMCQLAIADFANPMGLEQVGETAFGASPPTPATPSSASPARAAAAA